MPNYDCITWADLMIDPKELMEAMDSYRESL